MTANNPAAPKTAETEYKGNPLLVLNADSKWPFQFGLSKAKTILENLDAIRAFVAKHDNKPAASK